MAAALPRAGPSPSPPPAAAGAARTKRPTRWLGTFAAAAVCSLLLPAAILTAAPSRPPLGSEELLARGSDQELQQLRSEAQRLRAALAAAEAAAAAATRPASDAAWWARPFSFDAAAADLHADVTVLRAHMRATAAQLEAGWRARLAADRPRGVVITAGGASLPGAFTVLHTIRHHHRSTLPFAIMYWGALESDRPDAQAQAAFKEHLGEVSFIDLSALPYPQHQQPLAPVAPDGSFNGFMLKAFAVYAAPFQEVLHLDADSVPALPPEELFATSEWAAAGNLFWPDFWGREFGVWEAPERRWRPERLYAALHLPSPWGDGGGGGAGVRQTESGQLLLDRARHWRALEWLLCLNTHAALTYTLGFGDKDTFRAAFALAGAAGDFQQVSHAPAFALAGLESLGTVQLLPNGSAAFLHHNNAKLRLDGSGDRSLPALNRVTAPAAEDLAARLITTGYRLQLDQAQVVPAAEECSRSTEDDLPAAVAACAPGYLAEAAGQARLPVFELPGGSRLAGAAAAAASALEVYRAALAATAAAASPPPT